MTDHMQIVWEARVVLGLPYAKMSFLRPGERLKEGQFWSELAAQKAAEELAKEQPVPATA